MCACVRAYHVHLYAGRGPLEALGCTIEKETFTEKVEIVLSVAEGNVDEAARLIRNASSGQAEVTLPS